MTDVRDGLRLDFVNIKDATQWFEVLQTSGKSQTAVMTLKAREKFWRKGRA